MQICLLYRFLLILLLMFNPISSLANKSEPPKDGEPPKEDLNIHIDRVDREELNKFKPSSITPADVKFMEKQFKKLGNKLQDLEGGIIHHFTGERIIRDQNGKKMRVRVRGPIEKAKHQTRHFPAEAFIFYSAIGATMATKAWMEAEEGRTDPMWLSNLYHELTSPVGLFSFYCFLLASGQTGYAFAKLWNLENKLASVKAEMAIVQTAKNSKQLTRELLKKQKRLQRVLRWQNTLVGQAGLAMGIFASNVVTEFYYVMQSPAWDHCVKEFFRKDKTLNVQNKSLQCDLLADEAWDTIRSWGPAILSVLSASLISSTLMEVFQLNEGVKKLNRIKHNVQTTSIATQETSVKKTLPFISNLSITFSPTSVNKWNKWKRYAALATLIPMAKVTQWGVKFINLVGFMLIDEHLTHKMFEPINEYWILGDLRGGIDDFIGQYARMNPDEDGLICKEDNDCEYHPMLVSAHESAQQFSQWRQYKSQKITGAHHYWLMYINKAVGSAIAAQQMYTELARASTDLHAVFNKEHYFISEEDSFTGYQPTLIKDMRKTRAEISELEENIAQLEKSLGESSEENTFSEDTIIFIAQSEEVRAIAESQRQITIAERINLFKEALDELKDYKNANNINCQNQNLNLQLVSPDISPHPDYYFLTLRNSGFHLWTDAERACILEAMFNTIYSSDIDPFYADSDSAKQQAEDIIKSTTGGILEEELSTWVRDLLRKKVLSAGLELLGTISIQMRRKINDEAHIPVIDNYIPRSDKRQKRIDDQIAQNIFVKLHEKMKVIRSYPRGELYTKKVNDHYNNLAELEGHQFIPALFDLNIFRNDRMTDFMLSSFLCGENEEVFKNVTLDLSDGIVHRLAQGEHMTDIADDELSAVSRNFNGTYYTSVLPRFPALKLSDQELSQLCSERINTLNTTSGVSMSHRPVQVGNRSYPNLLHLVLDNIDIEKLRNLTIPFMEKDKLEDIETFKANIEEFQANIDEWVKLYNELNSSVIEDFVGRNQLFMQDFYKYIYPQIAEGELANGEITQEEFESKEKLWISIQEKIDNNQFAEISQDEINDFKQTLARGIDNSPTALENAQTTLENLQTSNTNETIKTIEPAHLFSIWWDNTIAPSINGFLDLSKSEFESMRDYQFPGPLFQNTTSEVDIAIDRTFDFAQASHSTHSSQDTEEIKPTELFPSLVVNNQLSSSISTSPVMNAGPGASSYSFITTQKHTLKVPEGIFANIHFEMTYWADLIMDMAKRKKDLDPDTNIDLATLRQQLNTFTHMYDVDKLSYDIQPINPEARPSAYLCHKQGTEGAWYNPITWLGHIKNSFLPVQVTDECSLHYNSLRKHWFDHEEYFQKKRCLRANYLPKKMGEQFGIDINVLYSRQMDSNYDRQLSAFGESEIHETTASDSNTLLDQLLKYALLRLNALEVEMSQTIVMRWDPVWDPDANVDKTAQHHEYMLDPPTPSTGKNSCDNYIEEFDDLIDSKVEEAMEEEAEAEEALS